jgi:hypothetical protein
VVTLAAWTLLIAERIGVRRIPALALCGWLAGISGVLLAGAFPVAHEGKAVLRQAGRAIRRRLGPGRMIVTDEARIALFAQAPTDQFVVDSQMSWTLYAHEAQSAADLLARCARTHRGRRFEVLAVREAFLRQLPDERLLDRLPPERFARLGRFGRGRQAVHVFRIRRRPLSRAAGAL